MSHHGTTKDDQQISQILAQMSTTAPTPPAAASQPAGGATVSFDLDPQLAPPPPPDEEDAAAAAAKPTATAPKKGGAGPGKGRGRGRAKSDERLAMKPTEWEQSRKDNHKEVERRRREAINAGINALNALLPADFDMGGGSNDSPTSPRASSSSLHRGLPPVDANGLPIPPSGSSGPEPSTSTLGGKKASTPTPAAVPSSNSNKGLTLQRAVRYIEQFDAERQRLIDKWTLEKLLMEQQIRELERERDAWRQECLRLGGGGSGGAASSTSSAAAPPMYSHGDGHGHGHDGIAMAAAAAAAAAIGNQQHSTPSYGHGLPAPPPLQPAYSESAPPAAKRPRV